MGLGTLVKALAPADLHMQASCDISVFSTNRLRGHAKDGLDNIIGPVLFPMTNTCSLGISLGRMPTSLAMIVIFVES